VPAVICNQNYIAVFQPLFNESCVNFKKKNYTKSRSGVFLFSFYYTYWLNCSYLVVFLLSNKGYNFLSILICSMKISTPAIF
jgi:hypothetical protein